MQDYLLLFVNMLSRETESKSPKILSFGVSLCYICSSVILFYYTKPIYQIQINSSNRMKISSKYFLLVSRKHHVEMAAGKPSSKLTVEKLPFTFKQQCQCVGNMSLISDISVLITHYM